MLDSFDLFEQCEEYYTEEWDGVSEDDMEMGFVPYGGYYTRDTHSIEEWDGVSEDDMEKGFVPCGGYYTYD